MKYICKDAEIFIYGFRSLEWNFFFFFILKHGKLMSQTFFSEKAPKILSAVCPVMKSYFKAFLKQRYICYISLSKK